MKSLLLLALMLLNYATAGAETETVYSSSNFSADLAGQPDSRPGTWGTAEAVTWTITFSPPAGCSVEITQIHGDLVAWPTGGKVEEGRFAGVLFGLSTTGPDGSTHGDWLADSCFLYVQDAVGREARRAPFSEKVKVRLLDDRLMVKVAVWLNDTGRTIHMEPTFTLGYRFVSSTGTRCLPDPPTRLLPPTPAKIIGPSKQITP